MHVGCVTFMQSAATIDVFFNKQYLYLDENENT